MLKREHLTKHTAVGRSFIAKVSLNSHGMISLSDGAVHRYGLEKFDFVSLYYDAEQRIVVIEPLESKDDEAMKLRKRETGAYIAAQSFIGFFQIYIEKTRVYELLLDKDSGLLYFELDKGKERKSGD